MAFRPYNPPGAGLARHFSGEPPRQVVSSLALAVANRLGHGPAPTMTFDGLVTGSVPPDHVGNSLYLVGARGWTDVPAIRTADFIGRQAVAAHPHYTDSVPQADAAGTLAAMRYLGIRTMRTEGPDPANQGQGTLKFLAENGIRFLFITGGDPATSLQRITQFLRAHPGSVRLIEGINEPNNASVTYRGTTGLKAAVAFQSDLYAMAKRNPSLAGIPVAGMASWPYLGAPSDWMNLHPYPTWARQPWNVLAQAIKAQQAVEDRPKAFVITEAGWHTLVGFGHGQDEGVDAITQAKLTLNLVTSGVALGARYVAVYTLYDEYPDPTGNNPLMHYGLYHFDGSPKPSAVALHNLNEIVQAGHEPSATFEPRSLRLRVSPDAHFLLLQGDIGDFFLVLWNEPDLWNDVSNQRIDPVDQVTTVRLDCKSDIAVFDPLVGTSAVRTAQGVSMITVALDGHPLVLRLTNRVGCAGDPQPATQAPRPR